MGWCYLCFCIPGAISHHSEQNQGQYIELAQSNSSKKIDLPFDLHPPAHSKKYRTKEISNVVFEI